MMLRISWKRKEITMKRILMRAAVSPLDSIDPKRMIRENTIGGNSGNMIFPFSLFRTLMTDEETRIDTMRTDHLFSDREAGEINEKYDCFIIPLANAFRQEFIKELKYLAALVDKLTIPCVVIGVGVQAAIDADMREDFPFDQAARRFVKSILKKSAKIGVRGEMTAAYLKKLGFLEEKEFTVTGCPSMYLYGGDLPVPRKGELTRDSLVCTNRKPPLPEVFHRFMNESMKKLPNHYFLPQNLADVALLYAGVPLTLSKHKSFPEGYPTLPSDELFLQDRVRAFTNVPVWMDFLRKAQFSFGSRIHGNITAVLSGTPCFIFACDSRVRELAEYHEIPHMWIRNMTEHMDIFEIYARADFGSVNKGHAKRFNHYVQFLNENGLEHVYDGRRREGKLPFDKALEKMELCPPIHSLFTRPYDQQAEILSWYDTWMTLENRTLKRELQERKDGPCLTFAKKMYRRVKG